MNEYCFVVVVVNYVAVQSRESCRNYCSEYFLIVMIMYRESRLHFQNIFSLQCWDVKA